MWGCRFIDETCWQLVRYPNLYASIAATVNFVVRSPRQFAEWIGKLMFWCGEDKIIYGSETPIWHPKWALDAFWNFEIPQDLVEGYGYPQLTEQAKRKILGENLLTPLRHGRRRDDVASSPTVTNEACGASYGPWRATQHLLDDIPHVLRAALDRLDPVAFWVHHKGHP